MWDKFFIIGSGEASVHVKKGTGGSKKVAVPGDGDFFGEMAVITEMPRTAMLSRRKTRSFLSCTRRISGRYLWRTRR